ncbi:hypothetical protein [Synechococcus sp. MU1611]|uniref:hypothetical protein n=1 Tax=Synechococcus sp. MU1611 TaxID=2508345 RepID=UPI001CF82E33|nr:hypothetical protein [Synechococcus sp. MU1611]
MPGPALKRQLQFVHIGKCGGSTVEKLLPLSSVVAEKYSSFFESHVNGVKLNMDCDYLFCIRNPVDRAFSAFEWRKKLILEDQVPSQVHRFPGEKDVLIKYNSLGSISRNLYFSNGLLNQNVARDFRSIHHLRESISFYCRPLLAVLTPHNLFGVVCQENLVADCAGVLGVDASGVRERSNASKRRIDQDLDALAVNNLKRFLLEDYQCLTALWSLGALSDQQFWRVMKSSVEA